MTTKMLEERGCQKGDDGQNQEKRRETQHDIHAAHDALVHQTAEIAGAQPQKKADGHGQSHRHEPDPQRNPAA